ncbi:MULTISPECIES: tRNA epoxyqueuosine(34) reductase QueG [unclassified Methylophaga]|jgi:epoxyqueuosine reductase|uniref:tRNA epoxyqueuosine(34) reductase QueG n=2 Tax=Methylophaga TaxID=40222 RepID=UPI000C391911|nr:MULTISPECIES: tRNA epoxyqueuosine(34) reductase QueG [unclassified Methylophaga]MAL50471.1 tRNA epoxyqueuosine(34) reductase QueG [Methylophaga sp.]MBP25914.1 tRNA epoxyqueuosine(34) reductase QueG [Methylophaga sp.]HCC81787.1 tRNA epoxyqueuosine(34) reductase QueG [Methylophaga sp.]|tara:strand:- start:1398 stop:2471 length:1074 start_codon:yes stop_codon:yes gene_type:complete
MADSNTVQLSRTLLKDMQIWARSLGFQQLGVSDIDLSAAEDQLQQWLARGFHGEMEFMQRHGSLRTHPEELMPGTIRVITARMDYWPETASDAWQVMGESELGFISRYALGRDYHKLIRKRLLRLSQRIEEAVGAMGYRVFTDSAPVMEKALAQKSGLGWIGKHTNVLNRQNGSYFFLGEIYTDLPLPLTEPVSDHCGSCTACIDICPTQAIIAPYELDARRCISYLTIELRGSIPVEFRPMMGNRIYGCDDCQLVCPWNKFAQMTTESAYLPREGLDAPQLVDLFTWTESEFLQRLEGSPIRRIGYECWLRNIAIALGNAKTSQTVLAALKDRIEYPSELVREHVQWALEQHNTPS